MHFENDTPTIHTKKTMSLDVAYFENAIDYVTLALFLVLFPFLRDGSKGELRKDHPRIVTV